MTAEKKYAACICTGCGLGDRLDIAALEAVAKKEWKMQVVKTHPFLWSAEGVAMIKADIGLDGITYAAILACSRRAKTEAFNFPTTAIPRGNLREGVIWVQPDSEDARETTQKMTKDHVRMACAEVKAMTHPTGNPNTGSSKTLLLLKGGRWRNELSKKGSARRGLTERGLCDQTHAVWQLGGLFLLCVMRGGDLLAVGRIP